MGEQGHLLAALSSKSILTTTEAALFEWCHQAGTAEFKEVSKLAKEELKSE